MTQKNNRNYAEQITLGCLAINKPLSFVKTIFLNREQNENHYIFNAQKETSLEIRFESSTLTCLFDFDSTVCLQICLLSYSLC